MPILPTMRRFLLPLLAVVSAIAAIALFVFEPWALWTNKTVDEAIPTAVVQEAAPSEPGAPAPPGPSASAQSTKPKVIAEGDLISHEHETSGRVVVLELPDKSRVLRLENLDTSNGPDVEVWITDAPVIAGSNGWHVFDDGEYVELGDLKGNHGNQNYEVPASVDLEDLNSVSLWCDRFNVSFAAAQLA